MESPAGVLGAAREKKQRLQARLQERLREDDVALTRQAGDYPDKYTWVPDEIGGMNRLLKERHPDLLADYNRYVLLSFMSSFSLDGSRYRLPASVAQLYIRELERIFLQAETFEDSFFDVSDDGFLKDLAILTHRLIPVGAEFAEGGAGIPRRILFAGGARQFFRSLWFVAVRCGGLRPFFALHAHTLALDDFNPTGWLKSYHRLAELVELNPQMKGWLSASWFLDPALETVSPHLAYLRKVPVENGAALLFVCHHRDGTSGALSKSPGRRRLFDEGKYVPATYMRIWPRKALIAWSRRRGKEPGLPLG